MQSEVKKTTRFINIGILDIRNASDKDLGKVKMVNVGHVLHTPETFDLLKGGKRINVGQYIEASPSARVLLSPTNFMANRKIPTSRRGDMYPSSTATAST